THFATYIMAGTQRRHSRIPYSVGTANPLYAIASGTPQRVCRGVRAIGVILLHTPSFDRRLGPSRPAPRDPGNRAEGRGKRAHPLPDSPEPPIDPAGQAPFEASDPRKMRLPRCQTRFRQPTEVPHPDTV